MLAVNLEQIICLLTERLPSSKNSTLEKILTETTPRGSELVCLRTKLGGSSFPITPDISLQRLYCWWQTGAPGHPSFQPVTLFIGFLSLILSKKKKKNYRLLLLFLFENRFSPDHMQKKKSINGSQVSSIFVAAL